MCFHFFRKLTHISCFLFIFTGIRNIKSFICWVFVNEPRLLCVHIRLSKVSCKHDFHESGVFMIKIFLRGKNSNFLRLNCLVTQISLCPGDNLSAKWLLGGDRAAYNFTRLIKPRFVRYVVFRYIIQCFWSCWSKAKLLTKSTTR